VRADRTIIVIGAFLSVIGLVLAWNGYGYVELERGWSLLIAGTIGFCTGLVLVALGLVLNQLAEIGASASKAALMLAKSKPGGLPEIAMPAAGPISTERDEDLEVLAKPVQTKLVEEPPIAPQSYPVDPEWEPKWDPEEELERALAAEARKSGAAATAVESEDFSEENVERPLAWTIRKNEDVKPVEAPPPAEPFAETEPPAESKPALSDDEWLFKAISGPLAGTGGPAPAEEAHIEAATAEAPHETLHSHEGEGFDHETEQPAAHPAIPAEPVEEPAKSEVIGHYEAQGAHYTMYADGSIDAETVHGVYRFASMEELKHFIEGQQE
jgi:hypothetical protein